MKAKITTKVERCETTERNRLKLEIKIQSCVGTCTVKATAGEKAVIAIRLGTALTGSYSIELWIRQLTLLKSTLTQYEDGGVVIMAKLPTNTGIEVSTLDL